MPAEFQIQGGRILVKDDGTVEVTRAGATRSYPLLRLAMLGQSFSPGPTGVQAYPARKGRVVLPYRLLAEGQDRALQLPSPIPDVEQVPVARSYFPDVKEFLSGEDPKKPGWTVVLDEGIPRIDLMSMKVKFPQIQTLVLHAAAHPHEETDHRRVRATDLVDQGKGEELVQNPVFLARLHLRNLELDRVKRLLTEFRMTSEEIEFVRTFLQLMIRNERKQKDLAAVAATLAHLDELFRMASILEQGKRDIFDLELDQMKPPVARDLLGLIRQRRQSAPDKEDQIYFWECEFRLTKIAEKSA